jgi:hypothetical protein
MTIARSTSCWRNSAPPPTSAGGARRRRPSRARPGIGVILQHIRIAHVYGASHWLMRSSSPGQARRVRVTTPTENTHERFAHVIPGDVAHPHPLQRMAVGLQRVVGIHQAVNPPRHTARDGCHGVRSLQLRAASFHQYPPEPAVVAVSQATMEWTSGAGPAVISGRARSARSTEYRSDGIGSPSRAPYRSD